MSNNGLRVTTGGGVVLVTIEQFAESHGLDIRYVRAIRRACRSDDNVTCTKYAGTWLVPENMNVPTVNAKTRVERFPNTVRYIAYVEMDENGNIDADTMDALHAIDGVFIVDPRLIAKQRRDAKNAKTENAKNAPVYDPVNVNDDDDDDGDDGDNNA